MIMGDVIRRIYFKPGSTVNHGYKWGTAEPMCHYGEDPHVEIMTGEGLILERQAAIADRPVCSFCRSRMSWKEYQAALDDLPTNT